MTKSGLFGRLDELEMKQNMVKTTVDEVVSKHNNLANSTSQTRNDLQEIRLICGRLADIMNAVVSTLPQETQQAVQTRVYEIRKKRADDEVQAKKMLVQQAVEQGYLKPVEVITETSIIETEAATKDGKILEQPYFQFDISTLDADEKKAVVGKKLAEVIEKEENNFVIIGIYERSQPPAQEPPANQG